MKPLMQALDSTNESLRHALVEAPGTLRTYSGNVVTDHCGYAFVELSGCEAENRDFSYQLTVIGQFAQAIVMRKVYNGRFAIKTDKPGVEVSWQTSSVRRDTSSEALRMLRDSPVQVL